MTVPIERLVEAEMECEECDQAFRVQLICIGDVYVVVRELIYGGMEFRQEMIGFEVESDAIAYLETIGVFLEEKWFEI